MEAVAAFLWPVLEILLPIALMVLAPLATAAIYRLFQKLGLDAEALNRDALQQAITRGALEAVKRAGGPAIATTIGKAALRAGVDQVKAGVPDAIARFNVPDAEIARRVEAQATAIVQSTPAILRTVTAADGHAAIDATLGRVMGGRR
ncbi:hypothetical protein VSX64_20630 [Aurantimonas sp. C2-6-R+9]|uniref:hypothetical protein n=1 Tax=unclassified Aurantimonas TaxID=2638230 RepID=UPI002E17C562|nr:MULTISPECIES: hypothetical protein [unclassified Aurantimonas]MEC5293123.1 hypothetical protein [Aurantimonas sp. C2-3-R2]MEC5383225.1 hypothetical protein [Aurantimonas sp. C2-6-R+9]MEC5414209.1 hypothetical protein [Aurantimonas sp. C2-4-R8]